MMGNMNPRWVTWGEETPCLRFKVWGCRGTGSYRQELEPQLLPTSSPESFCPWLGLGCLAHSGSSRLHYCCSPGHKTYASLWAGGWGGAEAVEGVGEVGPKCERWQERNYVSRKWLGWTGSWRQGVMRQEAGVKPHYLPPYYFPYFLSTPLSSLTLPVPLLPPHLLPSTACPHATCSTTWPPITAFPTTVVVVVVRERGLRWPSSNYILCW